MTIIRPISSFIYFILFYIWNTVSIRLWAYYSAVRTKRQLGWLNLPILPHYQRPGGEFRTSGWLLPRRANRAENAKASEFGK